MKTLFIIIGLLSLNATAQNCYTTCQNYGYGQQCQTQCQPQVQIRGADASIYNNLKTNYAEQVQQAQLRQLQIENMRLQNQRLSNGN